MIHPYVRSGLACLICIVATSASAQDQITESEVVGILNGKPRLSATGRPVGIVLHLHWTPVTVSTEGGKGAAHDSQRPADDLLYTTLIPLARALEAGVNAGSSYVVRLSPDPSLPPPQATKLGPPLLDIVGQFLTTYFTVPPERLRLELSPPPTADGQEPPQALAQRWRVEVLRQD